MLLADEALDGSGSGDRPIWRKKGRGEDADNDDEDEHGGYGHEDEEASGSGMGPSTPGTDSRFFKFILPIIMVLSCYPVWLHTAILSTNSVFFLFFNDFDRTPLS